MRKVTSAILAGICAVTVVGCGGSGGTILGTDQNPRIRLVDAFSTPASADLVVDSEVLKADAGYQFTTDYHIFKNGNHDIKFLDGTTSAPIVNSTELLELNQFYTAIAYRNDANNMALFLISDKPGEDKVDAQVRVPNVTDQAIDIYVTDVGADITTADPSIAAEAVKGTGQGYVTVPLAGAGSKSVQVRVTLVGSKVPLASTTLTVQPHDATTVVAAETGGNVDLVKLPTVSY